MNIFLPDCNTASRPYAAWAGAAALTLGALFGASNSYAAAPPANTLIGNQAVAAYTDSAGTAQTSTSNLVQTTVQQVGLFALDTVNLVTTTVINTKTGAGGNTVYAPHVLTNRGNGTDTFAITVSANAGTFSKVEVFADANNDGLPDSTTPLCSAVPAAICSPLSRQTVAGNGGTFPFVVAYTIPAGATAPTTPFGSGTVTATPGTPALYAGSANDPTPANLLDAQTYSAADVDNVNLTTVAAFSATKAISVPVVAGPSGLGWPAALTSGARSVAGCAATVGGALAPAAGCVYTTYTINYKNTGGAAGDFYMNDDLAALQVSGFTYVPGSAVWSGAGGVALTDAADGTPAGSINYFAAAGNRLNALVTGVGPNVSGTISFIVLVNNTAAVGTSTTTNKATYNPLDNDPVTNPSEVPGATGTAGSATTNPAAFTVTPTTSLVVGSATGTAVGSVDTTPGTPNGTAFDLNTATSIVAGGSVKFTHIVFNTGNAADTINLSSTILSSNFPAGSVVTFYAADGTTPLLDTNADGKIDTGSIATGASTAIVMQVTIPVSTPAVALANLTVNVVGTSSVDSTVFEASKDVVTEVIGALVDLTNTSGGTGVGTVGNGDAGAGPSPLPTTTTTTAPGSVASFPLFVKNNDSGSLTFSLAASQTSTFPGSLPAGWTVTFGNAAGCAAPITTVTVASTAQAAIFACVTPPASAVVGTTNIYFKVTSTVAAATTGVMISDTKLDAVTVSAASTFGATLTPDNNGQVAPGGTVVYAHTLNATGTQSCGTYTLNATQSQATAGWTFALFIDVNGDGQIDAGDTPVVAGGVGATVNPALLVGAPQKIVVRVFAPGGAVPGILDFVKVTATFAAANGGTCPEVSNTDTTTVVTGQIRVVKRQALIPAVASACPAPAAPGATAYSAALISAAKPGDCIVYEIVATNEGTAAITNLTINDAVPLYTAVAGAIQPVAADACAKSATVIGAPVYSFAPATNTVQCGIATTVPPGGQLTLRFAVKINQ
jgi:hypothetical protein